MGQNEELVNIDPEIAAISNVYAALKNLESDAQARVLAYVAQKLKLSSFQTVVNESKNNEHQSEDAQNSQSQETSSEVHEDEFDGISPVAKKWMTRNGFKTNQIAPIFSLGVDEIDLVAKTVPGKNKKHKMHNVFLLKGIAAYLSTGSARFTHEQIKEACLHYDAFDASNFALYFKDISSDVSGTKETGYTLTPRGLTNATELLKSILQ